MQLRYIYIDKRGCGLVSETTSESERPADRENLINPATPNDSRKVSAQAPPLHFLKSLNPAVPTPVSILLQPVWDTMINDSIQIRGHIHLCAHNDDDCFYYFQK